jgi:translation elongation factor EF-Tu-like GTPase
MPRSPDELGYLEAEFVMQTAEAGGRHAPIRSGYRPNWWLLVDGERINAGGTLELIGTDSLTPGGTARIRIYPFTPEAWEVAGVGTRLEASEGPHLVVGHAIVTRVVPAISLARGA